VVEAQLALQLVGLDTIMAVPAVAEAQTHKQTVMVETVVQTQAVVEVVEAIII
jgi:hypothetical protein